LLHKGEQKEIPVAVKEKMNSIGQPVPELPVADVERAQQHYRDVLGFEIGWLYPGKEIGAVSRGNVAIFFRKREPPFEPAVHWVFAEDIDASYLELKSTGANIVEPLGKKPWGLRQFTVKDLDGNLFYFHHD
jgi:uncharacterized glyoxalase superfamily protein PhnB